MLGLFFFVDMLVIHVQPLTLYLLSTSYFFSFASFFNLVSLKEITI